MNVLDPTHTPHTISYTENKLNTKHLRMRLNFNKYFFSDYKSIKWLIGKNVSQLMSIGSGWVSSRFYSSVR